MNRSSKLRPCMIRLSYNFQVLMRLSQDGLLDRDALMEGAKQ